MPLHQHLHKETVLCTNALQHYYNDLLLLVAQKWNLFQKNKGEHYKTGIMRGFLKTGMCLNHP